MTSRWNADPNVPRGATYDQRWKEMAAQGKDIHGEVAFVTRRVGPPPARVLDAGCGTGRVAVELAARGYDVVGTDLDPAMLSAARAKAPDLAWVEADLAHLALDGTAAGPFDAVVMAGNVMIFVHPGTEGQVLARLAAHLRPGGLVIAGFQVRAGAYSPDRMDADASVAGLELVDRYATWDDDPWSSGAGDYQVSVHRLRAETFDDPLVWGSPDLADQVVRDSARR